MNRLHLFCRRRVLLLAILGLVALFSPVADARVAPTSMTNSGPIIHVSAAGSPGSVQVTGEDFTPGGRVYVVLYDQWGQQLHENRWVTSTAALYRIDGTGYGYIQGGTIDVTFGLSETVYGTDDSQGPANGYVAGTAAGSLCGATLMVRAYDEQTSVWSSVLDADPGC